MTRYTAYERNGETKKIPIHPNQTTANPDPDGSHERMLSEGWIPVHVDPIPGLKMVRRPINTRNYL